MTLIAKVLMFLSSYAILFVLLAIRFQTLPLRLACICLAVIGVAALFLLLSLDRRTSRAAHVVRTVERSGDGAAAYLAGYLLPFVSIAAPTASDVAAYVIFLVVAAVVTIKTAVIQVNPLLFVLGYSIFRVTDAEDSTFYVLSRRRVLPGEEILTTSLGDDVRVNRVGPGSSRSTATSG